MWESVVGASLPEKRWLPPHSRDQCGSDVGSPSSREARATPRTSEVHRHASSPRIPTLWRWRSRRRPVVVIWTPRSRVARPRIQRALQFSQPDLSWVFNAYVIAFGGLLLLGGRLADLYGARRVFMAGFAILGGASLITGLATSDSVLLAGRALQGAGSALIAPAALTLLMTLFSHDPRELTKALALYGAAAPAGGTAGVFLGGVLTASLDWRWCFSTCPRAVLVDSRASSAASGGRQPTPRGGRTAALSPLSRHRKGPSAVGRDRPSAPFAAASSSRLRRFQSSGVSPYAVALASANLAAANLSMALLGRLVPTWFFLNYTTAGLASGHSKPPRTVPMTITIVVLMVAVTGGVVARCGFKRRSSRAW